MRCLFPAWAFALPGRAHPADIPHGHSRVWAILAAL